MITRARALALLGAAAAAPAAVSAQQTIPVKIGSVATDTYAEPFYGADMDFFKRAGFDAAPTSLENGVRDYVQNFLASPDPYR